MTERMDIEQTADQLRTVLDELADVVGAISPGQQDGPTPCTEYTVSQLRDHVLGWLTNFADGFADPGGQAPQADISEYHTAADPAAEVRSASARLGQALRNGAAQRPLRLGEAAMPGEMALGMILWEYQVHGWDLARATGQKWSPPAKAAQASLSFAPAMLTDDYQGQGKAFAPPVDVPAGAPPLDRLLGLSGRDPAWSPA
ncbi:MAG TPA: TIGR03086 family metal-binding protein [Streptosporangiaceae bacterium]|nr:TIGR03086 family metal-binding protein [Streptosporangiaceae bacterium]